MSSRKNPPTAPASPTPAAADDDSLDFTSASEASAAPAPSTVAGAKRARPDRARVKPRAATQNAGREQRNSPRRLGAVILGSIAIVVIAVFATRERSPEIVVPPPQATSVSPAYVDPPARKSPPASPRVPQAIAPVPPATASKSTPVRELPAEFQKEFEKYLTRSGSKAIALALDENGRWAYGAISVHSSQSGASEEAMSDCAKFKAQAGVNENCRLYAVGDKVVW